MAFVVSASGACTRTLGFTGGGCIVDSPLCDDPGVGQVPAARGAAGRVCAAAPAVKRAGCRLRDRAPFSARDDDRTFL